MRLKEIKPGMVIHCKTQDDLKVLSDAGISSCFGSRIDEYMRPACFVIIGDNDEADWTIKMELALEHGKITEFSDLIIPDLTAEEVLQVINDICNTYSNCSYDCKKECPFCNGYCKEWMAKHPEETVAICAKWKSDHEKKKPEIETVDICRIIEIQPNGFKRCVHEEDIEADPELPYGGEQLAVEQILKRYCMDHDGEYIAVREVVSRVKEKNRWSKEI